MPDFYRPYSTMAIVSALLTLIGLLGFAFPALVIAGIAGLFVGALAVVDIQRHQLGGLQLALSTAVFATLSSGAATFYHYQLFQAEAAAGAIRIDLSVQELSDGVFDAYEGRLICVKGYAVRHQGDAKWNPAKVRLSIDGNLQEIDATIDFDCAVDEGNRWTPIAVSGYLEVIPNADTPSERYRLKNSSVRPAKTRFLLKPRNGKNAC